MVKVLDQSQLLIVFFIVDRRDEWNNIIVLTKGLDDDAESKEEGEDPDDK